MTTVVGQYCFFLYLLYKAVCNSSEMKAYVACYPNNHGGEHHRHKRSGDIKTSTVHFPFRKEALVHSAFNRPMYVFRSSSHLLTQGGAEGDSGGVVEHNELLVASFGCVKGRRRVLFWHTTVT